MRSGIGPTITARFGLLEMADALQVRLLPGSPFHDRQELHRTGVLAALDPDRLLFEYRRAANVLQPPGVQGGYPGWDTGFLKGHMTGHYLSAASRMAAATGDLLFRERVTSTVLELARCQAALGDSGYLAAFPSTAFDWLEGRSPNNGGIVVPYYTIHKLMAGLLDAWRYLGNPQALEVAVKLADYFQHRLAGLDEATIDRMLRTDVARNPENEFGGMSDVLSDLFAATGDAKYLEMAGTFIRSWFVTPLATGRDHLRGLHANTHIAQAVGIANAANLGGDPVYAQASEHFWRLLAGRHSFVIGGNSFHEWLDAAGVEAGPSIDGGTVLPPTTAETCNSTNMLKLTSLLFRRSPRAEYADYYERTLYNHVLAAVAPDSGHVAYFTPLYGNFRTYAKGTYCCTGTGLESTPRYNEGIYFQHGNSLWINLYIPSELTWKALGLTARQEGNAGEGERVRLSIVKGGPASATLHLRIPAWISGPPELTVNGHRERPRAGASSYVRLSRRWKAGDVVTLSLPASLRLEYARDVPSMASVLYGPLVLAGELGTSAMPDDFADRDANLDAPPVTVPIIQSSSQDPADWLEPIEGASLAFRARRAGPAPGITFRPFFQVHHQRYSVYWPMRAATGQAGSTSGR